MLGISGYGAYQQFGTYGAYGTSGASGQFNVSDGQSEDVSPARLRQLKRSGQVECETCKNRKYQDGSNESDVSFKSPGHISPSASASTVMAHEQQHVANAYEKEADKNAKVISASVQIKTSVCPECGRSYVSDGQTNTMIKYTESNPYGREAKSQDAASLIGSNIDYAV
jgi:hypothetical protein